MVFFKYFFIAITSFYSYNRILNLKDDLRTYILYVISSVFLSLCILVQIDLSVSYKLIYMFLLFIITVTIINKIRFSLSLIATITSFGLAYIGLNIASLIVSITFAFIYQDYTIVPYDLMHLPIGLLQLILLIYLFTLKRLRNGMPFIKSNNTYNNIGIILSLLIIIFIIYLPISFSSQNISVHYNELYFLFLLSLLLIRWWNHRITQTYKEKLRLANQKSLEDELTAKLIEIETLKADNERLAKIIHKDNKLIPAMHMAVTDFLENIDKLPSEELSTRGQELNAQLYKMAQDRQGILTETHSKTNTLPQTGIHTVDGVLSYMETRATNENITYKLHIGENIKELILNSVSEEDLCHLLSDLIENAIIATRYSSKDKQMKIHLGTLNNKFLLEISDSGKEFDIETYQHFGYEKHTTHAEHGGSGIGLMDIWNIKKNNKISLQIYEYPPDSSAYTKKLSFVFDRKNHFLMQTYRCKEIISTLTRGDLYVFPYESKENI